MKRMFLTGLFIALLLAAAGAVVAQTTPPSDNATIEARSAPIMSLDTYALPLEGALLLDSLESKTTGIDWVLVTQGGLGHWVVATQWFTATTTTTTQTATAPTAPQGATAATTSVIVIPPAATPIAATCTNVTPLGGVAGAGGAQGRWAFGPSTFVHPGGPEGALIVVTKNESGANLFATATIIRGTFTSGPSGAHVWGLSLGCTPQAEQVNLELVLATGQG